MITDISTCRTAVYIVDLVPAIARATRDEILFEIHLVGFCRAVHLALELQDAGDVSQHQQDLIHATQGAASAAMLEAKLEGDAAWKTKPSWYIVAQKDETITPEQERFMSQRMGAQTVEVDSSHVPMISHPDIVVGIIKKAAEASGK